MDAVIIERFWSRVERNGPDECWPFLLASGERTTRYGQMFFGTTNRLKLLAHRVSWEIHNGTSPGESEVRHRCDFPPCVNPNHLVLGSHADNMRDMRERGRAARLKGEDSARAVLTDEQVAEIRARYVSIAALAAEYSVSKGAIAAILHHRNWRHL